MNKKLLLTMFLGIFMLSMAFAVDYDNISFTNEEFYNGAVTATKVLELSNGDLAVGYIRSSGMYGKICDLDGTNCGSEVFIDSATGSNANDFDIFEDVANSQIMWIQARSLSSQYAATDLSLTWQYRQTYQAGASNYVSAVQTNSTHFAIGYQDTADASNGKVIICKLDGSSCGSESTTTTGTNTYNKIILNSNGFLSLAYSDGSNGRLMQRELDGSAKTNVVFNTGVTSHIDMLEGSDNKLKIVYGDNTNSQFGTFRSCTFISCDSEIVYNSFGTQFNSLLEINNKLFVQNMLFDTTWKGNTINFNLTGGDISANSIFEDALTREISSIYTSNNQILISFDDVLNKGTFAISEPLTSATGITFNNPTQDSYINSTSFNLNVSFTSITNSTYSLNGGIITTLGTNTNESTAILTGIEGVNNLTVFTNTTGELSNSSISFYVDTTNPIITDTLPVEINSYLLNISNYVSCSDSNLKTCNITFTPDGNTVLVNQTSLYNFTYNGNQSYNIYAEDLAGNIVNKSGVILVNPYAYFQFNNSGTLLTDYTFGGTLWTNTTAKFTLYDDILTVGENNTINFGKIGYLSQSFTQEVLNTSRINVTFNVSQAEINVNIYDKSTLALIPGINFSLEFIGSVGTSTSTTTGTKTISNLFFLNEQYNLIVGNANYQTERVVFDFNNEENLTLNVYMVESNFTNLGYVQVKVLNLIGQSIAGATVQALQWDSTTSAYLKVSETQTGEDGIGNLNIILDDKFYIFKAFTNSVNSVNSTPQIINTIQNGKIIFLTLQDSQTQITGLLQGVSSSVTEVYSKSSLQSNVTFTWTNRYGGALTPCINVYRYTKTGDKNIISSSCATPSSSGVLLKSYIINSSYDIVIIGEYQLVGGGYLEIDSFLHYGELNINNLIEDFGLQYYILILVFILCVYVIVERSILIGTGMLAGLSGISIFLIPTILSKSVLTFVMFICVAIIISIIRGDK